MTHTHVRRVLAQKNYTDAEIEQVLKVFPFGGYTDFEGQDCNDWLEDGQSECLGWDGLDRRCMCGNRRVSWIVEGDFAYGEAH